MSGAVSLERLNSWAVDLRKYLNETNRLPLDLLAHKHSIDVANVGFWYLCYKASFGEGAKELSVILASRSLLSVKFNYGYRSDLVRDYEGQCAFIFLIHAGVGYEKTILDQLQTIILQLDSKLDLLEKPSLENSSLNGVPILYQLLHSLVDLPERFRSSVHPYLFSCIVARILTTKQHIDLFVEPLNAAHPKAGRCLYELLMELYDARYEAPLNSIMRRSEICLRPVRLDASRDKSFIDFASRLSIDGAFPFLSFLVGDKITQDMRGRTIISDDGIAKFVKEVEKPAEAMDTAPELTCVFLTCGEAKPPKPTAQDLSGLIARAGAGGV